jgi:short-chain fatty acids transporter
MNRLTAFFTELMRKYLPDPFVFAIALSLLTVLMAMGIENQSFGAVTRAWGKEFWSLLAFTT